MRQNFQGKRNLPAMGDIGGFYESIGSLSLSLSVLSHARVFSITLLVPDKQRPIVVIFLTSILRCRLDDYLPYTLSRKILGVV